MKLFYYLLFISPLLVAGCTAEPEPVVVVPPQPKTAHAELLFAGDLMQHIPQVNAARRGGAFDYSDCFAWIKPHFTTADVAVVNLETTLSESGSYTGYPRFRSPVALADAVCDMGIDVALLANNHCCDDGAAGVRTTLEELSRRGIRHTGLFADSVDYRRNNPLRLVVRGIRFALLNYTYSTNGMPVPKGVQVNLIDTLQMARDLADARAFSTDCVVVCMHWGNEYERKENASQRRLATFLRRHGADLIVGSHPHVIQPFEADSSHVTLYSLGNFVSNQRDRYRDGGLIAKIGVTRHPDGRMEYALRVIPVWVMLPGYRIVPPEVGDTLAMPVWLRARYEQFKSDTWTLLAT